MIIIIIKVDMTETVLAPLWLDHLKASGYRITTPLRVIVSVLCQSDRVIDTLDIYDQCRKICPQMGLVTVYRALEKMEEVGLVQQVHQTERCHGYIRAARDHEHILLCIQCGRAEYYSGNELDGFFSHVEEERGFKVSEHWLQLVGLCRECR